jgi:hypothetical protein
LHTADFLPEYSQINGLDLIHEFTRHLGVAQTAIGDLITWHLEEEQISVQIVLLNINAAFHVRFNLHLDFKNIILMQHLLHSFGRLIILSGGRDFNLVGFVRGHFGGLLLWILLTLIFFIILQNVNGLFLV